MSRIVVSLGGNALGKNPQEQKELLKQVATPIVELIKQGHEVVIAHGNGPQVGMINLAFSESVSTPEMPFPECGAMSQGYIGFHLQNAIGNELAAQNIDKTIASIVTQVIVDENDPAFKRPTKPIGSFYTKEESDKLTETKGYDMIEDSGRGYRRVVPSPLPIDVKEKAIITSLLEAKHIVITVGGGGIPCFYKRENKLQGIDAVIDKDLASSLLASQIHAHKLFILTDVPKVCLNFNTPQEKTIDRMSIAEAKQYLIEGQFADGSMAPKIQAAINFIVRSGKDAIITAPELLGVDNGGTRITIV